MWGTAAYVHYLNLPTHRQDQSETNLASSTQPKGQTHSSSLLNKTVWSKAAVLLMKPELHQSSLKIFPLERFLCLWSLTTTFNFAAKVCHGICCSDITALFIISKSRLSNYWGKTWKNPKYTQYTSISHTQSRFMHRNSLE